MITQRTVWVGNNENTEICLYFFTFIEMWESQWFRGDTKSETKTWSQAAVDRPIGKQSD